jgi:hypothetical protein
MIFKIMEIKINKITDVKEDMILKINVYFIILDLDAKSVFKMKKSNTQKIYWVNAMTVVNFIFLKSFYS